MSRGASPGVGPANPGGKPERKPEVVVVREEFRTDPLTQDEIESLVRRQRALGDEPRQEG